MGRRATILFLLAIACWLAFFPVAAQSWEPKLWKLTSDSNTVYVLGSIHAGTPAMYPLPAAVEQAFTSSPILLVETHSTPSDKPLEDFEPLMEQKGFYPPNDSLWNHIDKETRRRLTDFWKKNSSFKKNGMKLKDAAHMRPWAVALTVDLSPLFAGELKDDLGVDNHFVKEAEQTGKRVFGIETEEFQFRLMSSFPEELQVKWLRRELGMDAPGVEAIDKAMVDDRNPHMADVAEKYLKGYERTFIVVGSAHVGGDQGIVRLIEKRGYKVEEVDISK